MPKETETERERERERQRDDVAVDTPCRKRKLEKDILYTYINIFLDV